MEKKFDFGMIGLGVMGQNLLYNMADHGFSVLGLDLDEKKAKALEAGAPAGTYVKGTTDTKTFVEGLSTPRRITLLVPAGKPVDAVVASLLPYLEKGDIIIDGGNSHYTDTLRRVKELAPKGFHFMGMGVSGGEKGARFGPSIMPGGDKEAYNHVQPLLEAISAKVGKDQEPCTAYMGKDAAGHFVKMVHNGIEYAIMEVISEAYDLLKNGLDYSNDQLHGLFAKWNEGRLSSFLIEITRDIFATKDPETGNYLVDMILDKAGAKGTGKWTSQDAMDTGVAIPSIDMAVSMRTLSAYKEDRLKAAALYQPVVHKIQEDAAKFEAQVEAALYISTIICYAQGLSLLVKASEELQMEIPLKDVVKIWRGGCIIRSTLLETFYQAYLKDPNLSNVLLDPTIAGEVKAGQQDLRDVVSQAAKSGIAIGAIQSSLAYLESFVSAKMPTNLIQAQRDNFGSHTYQRTDKEGIFHTEWEQHP
ncbi:6-phosphogluconate dehydrogenase (decarboxylating) [Arachidicoccus rhizosphaerae]|uniref:6-phosphogluconate dehydrogenase, decarboxylating n=1 Tax=Arachidicoccus rhizosphaerae TaxID=551991 RepID=A0A1H3Z6N0_9BACT|nr:NADP-dependent phosphogluconate dehydrogenase [Arachidicoccus rhizosphaerae]SEA19310.1 6-phosphogluconate dehydrogenase (decarboxylating) [Arachidicoccus rhizosphaerae]